MANKKLNQFPLVTGLNTGDFLVGYLANASSELRIRAGQAFDSDLIGNESNVSGDNVTAALNALAAVTGIFNTGETPVISVFGRNGAISAISGDYNSNKITNNSAVAGANVTQALNALNTSLGGITYAQISTGEIAAGTETGIRIFSPSNVRSMIDIFGGGDQAISVSAASGLYRTNTINTLGTIGEESINFQFDGVNGVGAHGFRTTTLNGINNDILATSTHSTILNGSGNSIAAQNNYSTILNGIASSIVSGNYVDILNGSGNAVNKGNYVSILNGFGQDISDGNYDTVLNGYYNYVNPVASYGHNIVLNGRANEVLHGQNVILNGDQVFTDWPREVIIDGAVHTSRKFKRSNITLHAYVTSADLPMGIPMFTGLTSSPASSLGLTPPVSSVVSFDGIVTCRDISNSDGAMWELKGLIKRNGGGAPTIEFSSVTNIGKSSGLSAVTDPTLSIAAITNYFLIDAKYVTSKTLLYVADLNFLVIK